jgi:hypothetical protein
MRERVQMPELPYPGRRDGHDLDNGGVAARATSTLPGLRDALGP